MPFAYYNDHDPDSVLWLRSLIALGLIADGEVDERSILDVTAADLVGFTQCHFFAGIGGWSYALRLAGWPDDKPVWTGSPPCQSFSVAGLQKGKDDERHLAPHFAELVAAGQPEFVFGEQVASAAVFGPANTSKSRAAKEPEWAWIDDLRLRLEAACYAVGAGDIPAASVGAPHIRQRTFFGAARQSDGIQHTAGDGWQQRGSEPSQRSIIGGCSDSLLADSDDTGLEGRGQQRECAIERAAWPSGVVDGMADADGGDSGSEWQQRSGQQRQFTQGDGVCGLEHPDSAGQQAQRLCCHGSGASNEVVIRGSHDDGMADDKHEQRSHWERLVGPEHVSRGWQQDSAEASGLCGSDGLADAERIERGKISVLGLREISGSLGFWSPAELAGSGGNTRTRPHNFWSNADWIFCRDGKWRPIEPSPVALADGLSEGVGRSLSSPLVKSEAFKAGSGHAYEGKSRSAMLRGYGNAIVPQAAAIFITSFMESLADDSDDLL